jgi:predicted permease
MTRLHALIAFVQRALGLSRRRHLNDDLDDELTFHLAMRETELVESGVTPADAAREARRRLGNRAVLREQSRDMWTFELMESTWRDVTYALRALWRAPGFAIVAILALSIGIGANTAVFTLVDALIVHGLPYAHADRLVVLIGNVERASVERRGNSYPDHLDWVKTATAFDGMAAYDGVTMTLERDEPIRIAAEGVSASYFDILGVGAARGRVFRPDEDQVEGRDRVVVLSDALWRSAFGADPGIVGRAIPLNGRSFEVVGVMPPGFTGVTDGALAWVPFVASGAALTSRGSRGFQTLARLKDGMTLAAAQAEMTTISKQLETAYPETNEKRGVEVARLGPEILGDLQQSASLLMVAVVLVLLIACANVANLLVSRSETRRREIAVRTALGAGQARLLRQLITESVVLAALGAIGGLVVAYGVLRLLISTSPVALPSFATPSLNLTVMIFTILVALLTGVLLGLAPAMHARLTRLADALKSSARGSSGGASRHTRGALVIAEVALTVVLVVGAGLMIRAVKNVNAIAPGYDANGVLTLNVTIPRLPATSTPPPLVITSRALVARLAEISGVTRAAIGTDRPLGGASAVFYEAEGHPVESAQSRPRSYVHMVSPGFFDTYGIAFRAGRTFTDNELNPDSTAVIVSENMVARFWPGESPIGKRVRFGGPTAPWGEIVGVVPATKYRGLPDNPTADPDMFLPMVDRSSYVAAVRSTLPMASVESSVRRAIREAVPGAVIFGVTPLSEAVAQQTESSRFTTWVLGVFAAIALGLAAIGLYGVMAYLVSQRKREFGIRLALGAGSAEIVGLVMRHGLTMVGIGVAVGGAASVLLARWLSTLLFAVPAADPAGPLAVLVLIVVAVLACAVPAFRATRVDPVSALRNE